MLINEIIDSNSTKKSVQSIYQYVKEKESELNTIYDDIYTDISNQFPNTALEPEMNGGCIRVVIDDPTTMTGAWDMINHCIEHHIKEILPDADVRAVSSYAFKINTVLQNILIQKRR